MVNNDYRTMFQKVIGPILTFAGFFMNETGVIQQCNSNNGIKLSGRSLYVPYDGADQFSLKESSVVIPFNPFKILEHTLILAKVFCKSMSDKFMDDDDEIKYDANGDVVDIVSLVRRIPKTSDNLPQDFHGVIYELWCRDESEVLSSYIDMDGNDIKAIIGTMLIALSKYSVLVEPNPDLLKLFRYVDRVENKKDSEFLAAKSEFSKNLSQIDLSTPTGMDAVDLKDEKADKEETEESEEDDYLNRMKSNQKKCQLFEGSVFDDIDF